MHVQFWGAARTVTGSMHLVQVGEHRILLDCGLYQGRREEAYRRNRDFPFTGQEIDAVVLSHAHIDHSGNLPSLVRSGFRGPIFSTSATRDLASIMLLDAAKIQESDTRYVNKKREKKQEKLFKPLYETPDALETIKLFRSVECGNWFDVTTGVRCRFHFAGHMLGAAVVELELRDPGRAADHPPRRLVFSGDIGRPGMPLLPIPSTVEGAEFVIMEATYGNRLHAAEIDARDMLLEIVQKVSQRGGKLIVPAFSVGRTQEIVYHLNQLHEAGRLPPIKVFVDSPLAVDATEVFRTHIECFNQETIRSILQEEDRDPLNFQGLFYVRSQQYSKRLNSLEEPCIIISASGMCEAGRVLHHLKNNIENPRNAVMFAGYQAEHTLGRYILNGAKEIKIFGEPYQVRADVFKLEASSGHADQSELIEWTQNMVKHGRVKKIALVHAETDAATELKMTLSEKGIHQVIIPDREDVVSLDW